MPKVYRGYSEDSGSAMGPEVVFVQRDEEDPYRLPINERHSSEHSWGYLGSGPSQLARDILADHLGYVPPPSVYQSFKEAFVARWEQGKPWSIDEPTINEWIVQSGSQEELDEHLAYLKDMEELQRLSAADGEGE